jgi:hypothetical protein
MGRPAPGAHSRFVQIWHRRTKPVAAPRCASHITNRQAAACKVVSTLWHNSLECQAFQVRASASAQLVVGCQLSFWHLSAREGRRRLGRFQHRKRFIGAKSTRHTILVGLSTRPRAQRSAKSACRSMSRASRKRTPVRTGMLQPTNTCPRVLAQHPALAVWVGVPELVTNCCSDGLC